jgi:hypothetical protein
MRSALVVGSVFLLVAGCSDGKSAGRASGPMISPAFPPTPNTWRRYPSYPSDSCWARPTTSPSITRAAPSLQVSRHTRPAPPEELVRRLLARLGDRSIIRDIEIDAPPPARLLRHVFPGEKPPANALWAYIDAPRASGQSGTRSSPEDARAHALAQWEATLVGGALRDDFCAAGGRPLVGWTVSTTPIDGGVSDGTFALNQDFPNLSPGQFLDRLALVGERFGFEVRASLLLSSSSKRRGTEGSSSRTCARSSTSSTPRPAQVIEVRSRSKACSSKRATPRALSFASTTRGADRSSGCSGRPSGTSIRTTTAEPR